MTIVAGDIIEAPDQNARLVNQVLTVAGDAFGIAADLGLGYMRGTGSALTFGLRGGPESTDSLASRIGQAIGTVHVGVNGGSIAGGGAAGIAGTGGTAALTGVPELAITLGGSMVFGAAKNGIAIITTPMQMKNSTLEPGPYAEDSIPARGPGRDFTPDERRQINEIGQRAGCHTCGTRDPGTKGGNFALDHQPPNNLNPNNMPQRLYPHCIGCSRRQGGDVTTALREQRK